MKSKHFLAWLVGLTLLLNTGANAFVLYTLSSRIYAVNDDFRSDSFSHEVWTKLEADNIKLPPLKVFKFLSAYPYSENRLEAAFLDKEIIIFINLNSVNDLNDAELKALIAHEIGHYALGHSNDHPKLFRGVEEGSLNQEISADAFAAKYEGKDAVVSAIKKLVWDDSEKKARIDALNNR